MASISMVVGLRCIKNACGDGEWFGYTSVSCIEEEDYHNGNGYSCREGDDDDDGGYDQWRMQGPASLGTCPGSTEIFGILGVSLGQNYNF
jgi:hypothetical protein